jgi:hypothetical protein
MKLARPRPFLAARRVLFAAAIVLTAGNCTLNVDVNGPSVIIKDAGDNQTAPRSTQLPEPFTVLVANQFGQSLKNVTVTWSILSGGGSLSETSNKTIEGGVSSVTYTTGPTAGTATIQARVSGISPVVFTVTVT